MFFFAICLAGAIIVSAVQLRFFKRQRRVSTLEWNELVARIQRLDSKGLREIADCYLHPTKDQLRIQPAIMWQVVGGLAGMQKLLANADAMLDLAMYAERWNDANGRVLSEIMRRDAIRVRRAVRSD